MRAWVVERPAPIETRPLLLRELPAPVPAEDELLVKVRVCALCRTDLHVAEGDLPPRRPFIIPGHQIVGEVVAAGAAVREPPLGRRVGIAWLQRTDGICRCCRAGRENLCEHAVFTGWMVNGGYAEFATVPAGFAYPLPADFSDEEAAPLLCAGIIGYRALRLTGIGQGAAANGHESSPAWRGARLGLYGFGAAGHIALQLARARGAEVYVCTRDRQRHQPLAAELGAAWVGDAAAMPPVLLDAAIIFAPAGELVPPALTALSPGGVLVLGGIHMSPLPSLPYERLYRERVIRSVANNTRQDGRDFLAEAARVPVRTRLTRFAFAQADEALIALKHDGFAGAGLLRMA